MKIIGFLASLGMAAGLATAASAEDIHTAAAPTQVLAAHTIESRIDQLGYDVLRLERDAGAYEARILDRASGGVVKTHFDLVTGELLRASLAR